MKKYFKKKEEKENAIRDEIKKKLRENGWNWLDN
jgi:hypothetical protein